MASVERIAHVRGSRQGLATLEQRFRFSGEGARAAAIADVLLAAPLTGSNSVFGDRPGDETSRSETSRTLRSFSPAPGFRFDVELAQQEEGLFRVRFSQPERDVAYLQGDLVWKVAEETDGATLHEEINTERALQLGAQPLTGPKPSLRRRLFFLAGHTRS